MTSDRDAVSTGVEGSLKAGEIDVSRVFWMAGGTLPSFLDVEGQQLVLLTLDEYRELTAARSQLLRQAISGEPAKQAGPRLGLSTIERDPEVADFLRERFRGGVTVEQLHAACVEAFGAERTPSTSRIVRFRLAVRRSRR